ncbi:hypothetical protein ACSBR2_029480 [Camellia fascicularis]
MEDTKRDENNSLITEKETKHQLDNDCHDDDLFITSLPKVKGWLGLEDHLYQGFWCPEPPYSRSNVSPITLQSSRYRPHTYHHAQIRHHLVEGLGLHHCQPP